MFAIIDQTMTNRPWHLFKLWSSLPIPIIYLICSIIYWAAGGTNTYANYLKMSMTDLGGTHNHSGK